MLVDQDAPPNDRSAPPIAPPADLAHLAAGVDQELELAQPGAAAAAEQAAAAAPKLPLEQELAGMFALMGTAAGQFLPSVGATLDEAKCRALGDVFAPVMHKYGLARFFEGFAWRVELQALMVAVPIGLAVVQAAKLDLAAARAAAATAAAGGGVPSSALTGSSSPAPSSPQTLPDTRGLLQPIDVSAPAP